MTILFENIQTLCKNKNIKLAQLSRDAGVPEDSLQNWKKERIWMVQLPAIAKQLDVSIDTLFRQDNLNRENSKEFLLSYLQSLDYDTLTILVEMSKVLLNKNWE